MNRAAGWAVSIGDFRFHKQAWRKDDCEYGGCYMYAVSIYGG